MLPEPARLGVLVSGRGSNLEAVLGAVADGRLAGVRPVLVISNRAAVRALAVAAEHGIPSRVLRRRDFGGDAVARDGAIGAALRAASVDVCLLAGYDQLLSGPYFAAFSGRTINVHPSLLPRYGGRGMLGLTVHRAVLAAGERESGATLHEVSAELDAGPILAQVVVPVAANDDAEALASRVLAAEHRLVVEVLASLTEGRGSGTVSATMPAGAAGAVTSR